MQKRQDVASIIGPPGLIPVVWVNVDVYTHGTTTHAAIFSDNSSTVTNNPLTTDSSGRYYYYAADGRYDETISGAGIQTTTLTDITGTRNGAIGCTLDGDLSGSSGGIRLQSVTTPYAIGNTVRSMAGIGVRNESSNSKIQANSSELCTGGDFTTNTVLGIHEGNNWFDRQPANTPKLRYSTVPLGAVAYGTLGTDTATVAGTIYWAECWVDKLKSITGVGTLNGATVGLDKVITALYDSDGTLVANSALAGVITSGPNVFQDVAFTAAYIAAPGRYWIAIQRNGTTDTFRSIAASTYADVLTKSAVGAFGTLTTLTAPSTFTATVGPIAYVY